jgi:hypothetical protein
MEDHVARTNDWLWGRVHLVRLPTLFNGLLGKLALSSGTALAIARLGSVLNDLISPVVANSFFTAWALWVGVVPTFSVVALHCTFDTGLALQYSTSIYRTTTGQCEQRGFGRTLFAENQDEKAKMRGYDQRHRV